MLGILASLILAPGCVTPRYIGAVTRDGAFVHRGYGLVVDVPEAEWRIVRTGDDAVPSELWPQRIDRPLDMDADGRFDASELTSYEDPTLRLLSLTSTGTRVDFRVRIVGPDAVDVPVERMLRARQSAAPTALERRTVALGFDAWIGRCDRCPSPRDRLVALIDQQGFGAERGTRRQIVSVELLAPEIDDERLAALRALLDHVVLARRADRLSSSEARTISETR